MCVRVRARVNECTVNRVDINKHKTTTVKYKHSSYPRNGHQNTHKGREVSYTINHKWRTEIQHMRFTSMPPFLTNWNALAEEERKWDRMVEGKRFFIYINWNDTIDLTEFSPETECLIFKRWLGGFLSLQDVTKTHSYLRVDVTKTHSYLRADVTW